MKNPALARLQAPRRTVTKLKMPESPPDAPRKAPRTRAGPAAALSAGPAAPRRTPFFALPPETPKKPAEPVPDDAGVAIKNLRDLARARAPVSAIIVADDADAARELAPAAAGAAAALWQLAREGLGAKARDACRALHTKNVPLAYVLLAASEAVARDVASSSADAEDDAALLWRDAHCGASFLIWRVPAATAARVEVASAAKRAAREAARTLAALPEGDDPVAAFLA